jgi:hypothetical protein
MRANNFVAKIPLVSSYFCGLIETAESDPAISLEPRDVLPWSHGIKMFISDPRVSLRVRNPIPGSHWRYKVNYIIQNLTCSLQSWVLATFSTICYSATSSPLPLLFCIILKGSIARQQI